MDSKNVGFEVRNEISKTNGQLFFSNTLLVDISTAESIKQKDQQNPNSLVFF